VLLSVSFEGAQNVAVFATSNTVCIWTYVLVFRL